ncbi:hypothetical protein CEXT_231561 [Caerostris extrusa]|uniref:Uncharacterized protein n=1 Tax=Caerostris extrusa TaxID=172846 RepID=A0AAV4XHU0_CAEEX|nr:hypothetical protein CEXT_231561 [Caerostris extrusa]
MERSDSQRKAPARPQFHPIGLLYHRSLFQHGGWYPPNFKSCSYSSIICRSSCNTCTKCSSYTFLFFCSTHLNPNRPFQSVRNCNVKTFATYNTNLSPSS